MTQNTHNVISYRSVSTVTVGEEVLKLYEGNLFNGIFGS